MKDEIKEIFDDFKFFDDRYKKCNETQFIIFYRDIHLLLDYITYLQEEVEDLKEDNYVYHQLMKMQNKREYRSKFLKEFQEEFGTNTFPDYDEIYKRYDKVKKENKRLKELCDKYEEEHNTTFNEWKETITDKYQTLKDLQEEKDKYKDVIDKIKEYVKENTRYYDKELGLVEMMGAGATRIPVVYLYGLLELLENVE